MTSNMKNKRSSKPSETKRLDFRTTPNGVVPSSIEALTRLTLDAAMRAALTHASAKLVVEMDAGGTRVLLADSRSNQLIGGPEDLQKLGSIRAFVNRERKDAQSVEAAKDTTQLAFLATKVVQADDPAFEMRPVDNSYGAALRPLQTTLSVLTENEKKVLENTSETDRAVFEPQLKRLFAATKNSYVAVVLALTGGLNIKGLLKKELFLAGVPEWVHARITSNGFTLGRTEELGKFFFPADPTKGLALTVAEWRSRDFRCLQGSLLVSSELINTFINDDVLLRAMTGIANDVRLDDQENPQVAKLLAAKAVVMPTVSSAAKVVDVGTKSKSGFKFPTPGMDTVTGAIIALSTAVLRVYAANLQTVDLTGDYYATIAPGAVSRSEVTPTNNFYVQWGRHAHFSRVWIKAIRGGGSDMKLRQTVWRWLRTELRFSEKADAGKALARALELKETGDLPDDGHQDGVILPDDPSDLELGVAVPEDCVSSCPISKDLSKLLLRDLSSTEFPFWLEFQNRVFPTSGGKKKAPVGLALTPLTPQGKLLAHRVKSLSPYVSERMITWLRSFSDERLQLAAVKVTNAEFDDLFASALAEEDDAQSEVDWAETEA